MFESNHGGVSTRRNQKLALKQNNAYLNKIDQSSSFSGHAEPTFRPRTDERLQEAQPTVGYSISRNSGMSRGDQSMVNPSSSASRSRPSEQHYGAEKADNISIKFQSSNHDEPSNYEQVAQTPEMFAPASGFPLSKKSGNASKFKKQSSLTVVDAEIKNLPAPQGFVKLTGKGIASPGYVYQNVKYDYSPDFTEQQYFQGMSGRFAPQGTMPSVTPTEAQRKISNHGNEFMPGMGNESSRYFAAPQVKEIVTPQGMY